MSSGWPFRAACHQSPPIWTLGPLSEISPGLRCCLCLKKQAAPGAACWKKDRQPVRALVASSRLRRRDPGTGVGVVALEGSLDSPARPGPRRKSSQTS